MKVKAKTIQAIGVGIIVLVVALVSFFYWAEKKEIWFCDEVYSYESANGFEQEWPAANVDQWMSGKEVEKFFSADWDSLSLNDITVRLYNDHVPLYFWLFRMVSLWVFKGSGTIWIGLGINLFFYLVTLGLIYRVFYHLTNSAFFAAGVVGVTGILNCLMLEQAMTLRMYIMLLCLEVLLVWIGLQVLRQMEEGKMSLKAFAILFGVSLAGFLTHYHFWVFYAATASVCCMWLLISSIRRKKLWKSPECKIVLAWVGNFAAALLTTIIIFPYCRWNLNRGKGEMALQSLFVFSKEKIDHILWGYEHQVAAVFGDNFPTVIGLILVFGSILGGIIVLYKNKEIQQMTRLLLVFLICQVYQVIVCFTFPSAAEERYLWGSFTLVMLCMFYGIYLLVQSLFLRIKGGGYSKIVQGVVTLGLFLSFAVVQVLAINGGRGVAYLFYSDKDVELLETHAATPWVVYGSVMDAYSYYDLLIPEQLCFLTQEDTPEDVAAIQKVLEEGQFLLYTTEGYYPKAMEFFEVALEREITGKYLMRSTNLSVYLVDVATE